MTWGAVIVAVLILLWNGKDIFSAVQLFRFERRAMGHRLPASQVIVEGDPIAARRLASGDPSYVLCQNNDVALLVNPVWQGIAPHLVKIADATGGAAFMHQRREGGGKERLVLVAAWVPSTRSQIWFTSLCVEPARGSPRWGRGSGTSMQVYYDWTNNEPFDLGQFRLYAGQPDPSDPSRFTIPYRYKGVDGVIGGIVVGDTARLEIESGPLKLPK
jgi:hypothetical protein